MPELVILKILNRLKREAWQEEKRNTHILCNIFQVNHNALKNKILSPVIYIFSIK